MAMRRNGGPVREMIWNGKPERAAEIQEWARNAALLPRWQWSPGDEYARVLVERPFPQSAEWVPLTVGAIVRRIPPHPAAPGQPADKLEEADWPLEVRLPGLE